MQPCLPSVCVCRSIWTCVPQQSSILPASQTLAAPAPPVTTLSFPMILYRTSPASPSTSTSTETLKHEPDNYLPSQPSTQPDSLTLDYPQTHSQSLTLTSTNQPPRLPLDPRSRGWMQRSCCATTLPCALTLHAHTRS